MKPQNQEMPKSSIIIILMVPVFIFGLLGAGLGFIDDSSNPLVGFLWGVVIGIAILAVCGVGMFGWEWIKKEADKGKALPFFIVGIAVAVAISSYLAVSVGNPTCIESTDTDSRGSTCLEYADDGFEATSNQKWNKFWGTLPVTVIITSLVAVIVRNEMKKNKRK